jgi:hypothetical protein
MHLMGTIQSAGGKLLWRPVRHSGQIRAWRDNWPLIRIVRYQSTAGLLIFREELSPSSDL